MVGLALFAASVAFTAPLSVRPRSCMVTMQMDYGEGTRDGAPAYDPIQPQPAGAHRWGRDVC